MRSRRPQCFTVDQYDQMIEKGILTKEDRVELINGEIVAKMSIGKKHALGVRRLVRLFGSTVGDRAIVDPQNPLILDDSEPEPDVNLLKMRDDLYASRKPRAADVLLLVEVADFSLDDDREVKGPLYARNRIPEYWIVNLIDDCLEVYRSPRANGTWRKKLILERGDKVEILALPGAVFNVSDLV
jgi:Uma2 family endonuclease